MFNFVINEVVERKQILRGKASRAIAFVVFREDLNFASLPRASISRELERLKKKEREKERNHGEYLAGEKSVSPLAGELDCYAIDGKRFCGIPLLRSKRSPPLGDRRPFPPSLPRSSTVRRTRAASFDVVVAPPRRPFTRHAVAPIGPFATNGLLLDVANEESKSSGNVIP